MSHFLDKARDQISTVRGTVTDTLHSVRNEADEHVEKLQGQFQDLLNRAPQLVDSTTRDVKARSEEKAEKLKGEIKHILHKGPQLLSLAKKEMIKGHQFLKNGEDNGETSSPVDISTPVQVPDAKQEEENSIAAAEISTPVQVSETKKDEENSFAAFFGRIFEKCCEPFNKKKD